MNLRLTLVLVAAALVACGNGPTDSSRLGTDGGPGASNDAGTDAGAGTGTDGGTDTETDAGTSCDGWMAGGECRPFTTCETVDVEGTPTSDRVCLTDCELAWSDWGCCSLTGAERTQVRTATVSREASPHGKACPATLTESRPCEAGAPSCACDTATTHTECDRESACEWMSDTQTCRYKPVDCAYSVWSAWSACSYPCDLGTQTRTRTIVTQAAYGGKPCTDPLSVTQQCNLATRCECSILTVESQCSSYAGCQWSSGACVKAVEQSCDMITDEAACNASALCCEFAFGSCVPKTCQ